MVVVSSPILSVTIGAADAGQKAGFEIRQRVKGGNIPKEFIPSVEKGFKEAMKNGVLAGYPMDSMKVELNGWFFPRGGLGSAFIRIVRQDGLS